MKKHLLLLFAALLPFVASAHDFEVNGIYYNITSEADKTAEVTFKGDSYSSYWDEYFGSITIPATVTYDGVAYSVTSIGDEAFRGCSRLTAITLPEGVTSIGDYAFRGCSSLTAITLPEGVTSIGEYTFYNCYSLTAITLPESVTSIGEYAFFECRSLTAITLPEGVTSIGEYAFSGCSSLTAISFPEGLTSIGDNAFYGCSSLTAITIPESVTSIGDNAFYDCSSLTAINIPEGVTSIEWCAFYRCTSLTAIVLPKSVKNVGGYAFGKCPELTDVYCHAETVPSTQRTAFNGSYNEYATLHVPASALDSYRATVAWDGFGNIVALTDEDMGIEQLTMDNARITIYDLHGRRVATPNKDGIYIVDGKKVMVKTGK